MINSGCSTNSLPIIVADSASALNAFSNSFFLPRPLAVRTMPVIPQPPTSQTTFRTVKANHNGKRADTAADRPFVGPGGRVQPVSFSFEAEVIGGELS